MYRIVVCIDVEADSLTEAYRRVYKKMRVVDNPDFQWESSDEWYDDSGESVDPDTCSDIRMKVFAEESKTK